MIQHWLPIFIRRRRHSRASFDFAVAAAASMTPSKVTIYRPSGFRNAIKRKLRGSY